MKRFSLVALLTFACAEPTRVPADVGPRDAGSNADAGDSGVTDSGMTDSGVTDGGDGGIEDTGVIPTGICESRPCLTSVSDAVEWAFVSGPARAASRCDLAEETLFVVPKSTGASITETLYVDAEQYENLYFFLKEHLSTELANLDPDVFYESFERTDMRSYWSGRIFRSADGEYSFDLIADYYFGAPPEVAELDELRTKLMQTFAFPLSYAPQDTGAIMRAQQFQNPPFEVLLPAPCANEGCADPNAFCVVIPQGTELCGHFAEGRDVPGELARKIRLEVVPGSYALPRQVGTTTMRLFSGGEFGLDRTAIDASADGTLTVEDFGGYLSHRYTQRLTAGADTIELTWELYSGTAPLILREPFLTDTNVYGAVNDSPTFPDDQIVASSCTESGLSRFFAEGELANGDSFRFTYRHQVPFAGSGPLFVTGAEVTLGGQEAVVNDYFQLTYAGEHHNWNNQFVILFDAPLAYMGHDVYGLWIDEPGFSCCPVESIHTLDANHQKLDQLQVTSYLRAPVF